MKDRGKAASLSMTSPGGKALSLLMALVMALGLTVGLTRPAYADTVLAFTSDLHNAEDNTGANRLGNWIKTMEDQYGAKIDVMAFGGDMGSAYVRGDTFWQCVQSGMGAVTSADKEAKVVYTTGNHEYQNGSYTNGQNNTTKKYVEDTAALNEATYHLYALGSTGGKWNVYTDTQISKLEAYLKTITDDKPIFIITHYPLHWLSDRNVTNSDAIINLLNDASDGTLDGNTRKIVFLWGHNHTNANKNETNYDEIFHPGLDADGKAHDTIKANTQHALNFYYCAAGCMSDSEYGTGGSQAVKGKGLIVTIDDNKKLTFAYYDEYGNNVTENGTGGQNTAFTEEDPVSVTGITVSPDTAEVLARKTVQLTANVQPDNATNKSVTWTSSNEAVATVKDGLVRGKNVDEPTVVEITATTADGNYSAKATVTVKPNPSSAEQAYVIVIDGYAMTTEASPNTAQGGSSSYTYNGRSGVAFTSASEADDDARWIFEEADGGYHIKSLSGQYLVGTYESGSNRGHGNVTLSDTADDVWVLDSGYSLEGGEVTGSKLKSTKATDSSGSAKYLSYENDENLFTVRSERNADTVTIVEAGDPVSVTGVTVSPKEATVVAGKTTNLTATVQPDNATNKSVTWSVTEGSDFATVDENGKVTGIKAGTATVTATTADGGKTDTCKVTVTAPEPGTTVTYELVDKMEADKDYLIATGNSGSVYLLSGEAGSASNALKGYEATVVDNKITIDTETESKTAFTAEAGKDADSFRPSLGGNYLYADSSGNLRLEPKSIWTKSSQYSDNSEKYWHYKGADKYLLWFFQDNQDSSNGNGYNYAGSMYRYYLNYNSSNGDFTKGQLTSSNTSIASSNTPKIYLYAKAETPVTLARIEVISAPNQFTVGDTFTAEGLQAAVYYSDGAVFNAADPDIDSSKVDMNTPGTYTVTVSFTSDGETVSTTYEITVSAPAEVPVDSVTLSQTKVEVVEGMGVTLEATVKPDNATDKTVTWTSSDQSVATVNENGEVFAVGEGTATITATAGDKSATCEITVKKETFEVKWERLAGKGRYDTMAAIVREGFSSADTAILCTGKNFPDALVAASLAGALDGDVPVILTDPTKLSKQASDELARLGVKQVYVLGGTAAVSDDVLSEVRALDIAIERISGNTRQATSIAVMQRIAGMGKFDHTVVVATGKKTYAKNDTEKKNETGFADALSIGPWCYKTGAPILLTKNDGTLSDEQVSAAKALGVKRLVIVGGEAAVSSDVIGQLGLNPDAVERLGGENRYETSQIIADWEMAHDMTMANVSVATGTNFPDALAGAPLCGKNNSVLVLAKDSESKGIELIVNHKADISTGYVLGGEAAVSADLFSYLEANTK